MESMHRSMDKLLTRLRDMAFGRPRIKLIDEKRVSEYDVEPIFIIGTFRSGTTLLRYILDSHSAICCPPESKFLEPLASFYTTESCMRALRYMGYDEGFVKEKLRALADAFFIGYMLAHDKRRWADKTPEYIRVLDFIEWLYGPMCKYVLIYRNGLDTADSMNRTHIDKLDDQKNLTKVFEYWFQDTQIMAHWERKHPARCYSLKYEDLCTRTRPILKKLINFLEEDWEEDVLHWYKKGHDRGDEDIKARRQRGITLSFGNYKNWPQELQQRLKEKAASLHEMIGYDPETLMPVP